MIEQQSADFKSLKEESAAYQKLKEAFSALGLINSGSAVVASNVDVDEEKVKALIDERVDEKVTERVKEAIATLPLPPAAAVVAVPPGGVSPPSWHFFRC